MKENFEAPVCPYCGKDSVLRDSVIIYGKSYGMVWVCGDYPDCDSYVGCHPRTDTPLGTLANYELRKWRKDTHRKIDALWKTGKHDRSKVYERLAKALKLHPKKCHIAMFDVEMCKKVISFFDEKRCICDGRGWKPYYFEKELQARPCPGCMDKADVEGAEKIRKEIVDFKRSNKVRFITIWERMKVRV